MTYHEIMRKLCESGYKHEWNFGDRGFDSLVGVDFIVTDVAKKHTVLSVHYEDGGIGSIDYRTRCVPLPSVDQWMEKLWNYNLTIESGLGSGYLCRWNNREQDNPSIYDDDIRIALAILYARVVLGYKWDGKEFGKC